MIFHKFLKIWFSSQDEFKAEVRLKFDMLSGTTGLIQCLDLRLLLFLCIVFLLLDRVIVIIEVYANNVAFRYFMKKLKKYILFWVGLVLIFAYQNCGKMGANKHNENKSQGETQDPSLDDKILAVNQTAINNALCQALGDFYWELGDASGALVSGAVGTTYAADTSIGIASASKIVFGAFVVQLPSK